MNLRGRRGALIGALAIAVLLGSLASWVWAGRVQAAQQDERDDLNLFLDAASAGWAEVTEQFFVAPETAAQTISALAPRMETTEDLLALLAESIRRNHALDAAYLGFADGSFVFVARSDEEIEGGFRTRTILHQDDERQVEISWTDADLRSLRMTEDPTDAYDPRARPWFEPIAAGETSIWTAPYIFASSGQAGITHSTELRNEQGELEAVVGIDIQLSELSDFLEELSPGANGQALVVDSQGQVIAESAMDSSIITAELGEDVTLVQSPDLIELVAALSSSSQKTAQSRSADGERTSVVRPAGVKDEWYLAVQAYDADFLRESARSPKSIIEILAIGIASALLAGAAAFVALRYLLGLQAEAERDELTQLLNRRAIKRHLASLLANPKATVSVGLVDIDGFKLINDTHGHPIGDVVLTQLAARLEAFGTEHDAKVGRLGGDEFIMVATGSLPWGELSLALRQSIEVGNSQFEMTGSIGVAQSTPSAPCELDDLLRTADHALFEVKRAGGSDHAFA